jgi:NADH:ubiquinone oxidoreductase subunit E
MIQVTVCIGSSCHIKGSRQVVQRLQALIDEHALQGKVTLSGAFCMGNCMNGVCVEIDGETFSVHPESTKTFFEGKILSKL